jgi:hypothetical protein
MLIAASRLYLGAHWLLDVIASIFLGFTILLLTIINYQRLPKARSALSMNRWLWLSIILVVTFVIWGGNIYHEYHNAIYRYTPFYKKITTTQENWWANPLHLTPAYRDNRFGRPTQPLNLQWSGTLPAIKNTLKQHGWSIISRKHHIQDTIQRLASDKPQYHLPLFETLYHNKRPNLIMYKNIPGQSSIYLLRLWDAHINFKNGNTLWIGMVNKLAAPHSFITFMHHNLMSFAKLNMGKALYNDDTAWQAKSYHIASQAIPEHLQGYDWDRNIWLVRNTDHATQSR